MTDKRDTNVADLTMRVLREIRDEAKKTNARLDQTNVRLDVLKDEMHQGFDRRGGRIDNLLLDEHRHDELRGRVERIEKQYDCGLCCTRVDTF
jgi:hypothetical protein